MLKKFALRSGSSVSTAPTVNVLRPRRRRVPTGAPSAETSRSSIHTVPRTGPSSAGASGAPSAGAVRRRPRSG